MLLTKKQTNHTMTKIKSCQRYIKINELCKHIGYSKTSLSGTPTKWDTALGGTLLVSPEFFSIILQ